MHGNWCKLVEVAAPPSKVEAMQIFDGFQKLSSLLLLGSLGLAKVMNLLQSRCQPANRRKSTMCSKMLRLDSVSIYQDVVVRCKPPASIHAKEKSCSTRVFVLDFPDQ